MNLNSGEFTYQETDLSIPGINGLDLNFTRLYRSDDSQVIQPRSAFSRSSTAPAYAVGYKPYLCNGHGRIIEEITNLSQYTYYDGTGFESLFTEEFVNGYLAFPLYQYENLFVYTFCPSAYYEAAAFKSSLTPVLTGGLNASGNAVCVGFYPVLIGISPNFENYCENYSYESDKFETL